MSTIVPPAPPPPGSPAPTPPIVSTAAIAEFASASKKLSDTLEDRIRLAKEAGEIETKFAKEVTELIKQRQEIEGAFQIESTKARDKLNESLKDELKARKILNDTLARMTEDDKAREIQIAEEIHQRLVDVGLQEQAYKDLDDIQKISAIAESERTDEQKNRLVEATESINGFAFTEQQLAAFQAARYREQAKLANMAFEAAQRDYIKQKEYTAGATTLNTAFEKIGDTLFKTARLSESFGGSLFLALKQAKEEGLSAGDAIKKLGNQLADLVKTQFSMERIIGGALLTVQKATIDAVLEVDQLESAFNKVNGRGEEFKDVVKEASRGLSDFGVSRKETGAAYSALYADFNQFSMMNKEQQLELTKTASKFEKLGMSASNYAKLLDVMGNTTLKKSTEQIKRQTEEFARLSLTIGVATSQIANDYVKFADKLVVYGDNAVRVLEDLEKASKATGVSMDSLMGVAAKFDTFQQAAETSAKLNAIFGAQANALDLVNMKENERILAVHKMLEASGKQFKDLNRAEQMYITQTIGLKNVTEASKFYSKSTAELTRAVSQRADSEKNLNEVMERSNTIKEKFALLVEQATIALGPLITAVQFLVDGILKLNDITGGWLLPTLVTLLTLTQAITIAKIAWAAISGSLTLILKGVELVLGLFGKTATWVTTAINWLSRGSALIAPALAPVAPVAGASTTALSLLGLSAGAAAPEIWAVAGAVLAMGLAFAMVIASFYLVALGMKEIILAFRGFSAGQILAISVALAVFGLTIVGLALVLVSLGPVLGLASLELYAFGAAVLLVSLGMVAIIFALKEYKKSAAESEAAQARIAEASERMAVTLSKLDDAKINAITEAFTKFKDVVKDFTVSAELNRLLESPGMTKLERIVTSASETTGASNMITNAASSLVSMSQTLETMSTTITNSIIFKEENSPFKKLKEMIDSAKNSAEDLVSSLNAVGGTSAFVEIATIYESSARMFEAIQATPAERIQSGVSFINTTKELLKTKAESDTAKIVNIINAINGSGASGGAATATGRGVAPNQQYVFNIDITKVKDKIVYEAKEQAGNVVMERLATGN